MVNIGSLIRSRTTPEMIEVLERDAKKRVTWLVAKMQRKRGSKKISQKLDVPRNKKVSGQGRSFHSEDGNYRQFIVDSGVLSYHPKVLPPEKLNRSRKQRNLKG